MWEASEGAWEDARHSIEYRLKPEIEKLETCAGLEKGELLYEHTYVNRAIEEVRKENLDGLMSATQTFVRLLPVDILCFLRGMWPYKHELRTRTKWQIEGGAVEEGAEYHTGIARVKGDLEGVNWWEEDNRIRVNGTNVGICELIQEAVGHELDIGMDEFLPQGNEIEVEVIVKTKEKFPADEEAVTKLTIGSEVALEGKKGVIIDTSAEKFRVQWNDKTENWIIQKDSEIVIVY